ncbi:hypothetical protein NOF04DRAFT_21583 [Fusarium oxysporum II5]|nr:uncharacterized protein FOIG_16503 [Fusarium odoratissimum NRRL 54006]EXL90234.1 hypothetical protein FOIG_16503 [Fusarium odoratissimum NRRL 54006]KAK2134302.1 hypothetical protein NOF04DRAFT_21583 [Fusarium oxysporum II5]
MDFDRFLCEKRDEVLLSLKAGAQEVWKSRWHNTEGFDEYWQGDEVFQNLFTGFDSIKSQVLSVECGEIRSDINTISCRFFEAIGDFFDEHIDEFESLSLDTGAKIETPDVGIWRQEWELYSTTTKTIVTKPSQRLGPKGKGLRTEYRRERIPDNTLARSFYSHF